MPDVPTMQEQGYQLTSTSTRSYLAPAGTPANVVEALSSGIRRAMENPEYQTKMDELAFTRRYLGPQELATLFGQMETQYQPLIDLAKQK
jgi:tripartite-type tricarboxylate transporter receptor subunit TctC